MRTAGVVAAGTGFGPHDHVCWIYDERAEFRHASAEFLAEGIDRGLRVAYISDRPIAELRADMRALGDVDRLIESTRLVVTRIESTYAIDEAWTPGRQAARYAEHTRAALADGFGGLRVAADATTLVEHPGDRQRFTVYEHTMDQLMADGLEFSAMCGYDRTRLGTDGAEELARMHPAAHGAASRFSIAAAGERRLMLVGEVDSMALDGFSRALGRTLAARDDAPGAVVIDCSRLDFIDHRSLLTLDDLAAGFDESLRLVSAPYLAVRLAELIPLRATIVSGR